MASEFVAVWHVRWTRWFQASEMNRRIADFFGVAKRGFLPCLRRGLILSGDGRSVPAAFAGEVRASDGSGEDCE